MANASAAPWTYAAAASGIVNTTTAVTIKAAVPGQRNFVSTLQINSDALGTATEFAIRDGAGGTVLWRCKIPTDGIAFPNTVEFDPPLVGTANTLLEIVTLTASTTGGVYCNVQGFVDV